MKKFCIILFVVLIAFWLWCLSLGPQYEQKDSWYTEDGQQFENQAERIGSHRVFVVQDSESGAALKLLEKTQFLPLTEADATKLVGRSIDLEHAMQEEVNSRREGVESRYRDAEFKSMSTKQLRKSEALSSLPLHPFLIRAVCIGGDKSNVAVFNHEGEISVSCRCYGAGKHRMEKMPLVILLPAEPKKVRMWVWNIVG